MKKIILSQIILSFVLTNCQDKTAENLNPNKNVVTKQIVSKTNSKLDFKELKFGSNVVETLKEIGLNIDDNASPNMSFNMLGDIEEFQFPKNKKLNLLIAGNNILNSDNISFFIQKKIKKFGVTKWN